MTVSVTQRAPRRVEVQPPEPNLTPEELIARVVALRPLLREEQESADERGFYSEKVHREFLKAGVYRTMQPRMFGGYEFDLPTFTRVSLEISRGHPSTGWCFTLASSHGMEIASHWPEQAQRELFGPTGDFRAAHRAPPAGKVERVPGGYSISGTWSYSSGVPISTHFIGGAVYAAPGETPMGISFIVPVDKIEILPGSWGGDVSLGMQGSGSHSVRLDRVFVPEHHVTPSMLIGTLLDPQNGTAGTRLHDNPFYLGQLGGPFHLTFGGILTGTARAALDEYEELMRTRKVMFNPQEMRLNDPESQRSFGKALALTDSAEALTMAGAQMYMDYCARWGRDRTPISTEDTLRLWCMAQEACFMACNAVDLLFRTASATAANRGQRMQRYFRDIQMYLIHPSSQPWTATARAQAHLKLPIAMFGVAPQTVRVPSRPE